MVKPFFWALLGPPHFPPFYRFTGFKKLISSVKVWQVSSWKYACFCFFGRGIDWWHFRKCPKNRVARFHTAGLPDYEILAYFGILKRTKGLKICILMFFWTGNRLVTFSKVSDKQGCQISHCGVARLWNFGILWHIETDHHRHPQPTELILLPEEVDYNFYMPQMSDLDAMLPKSYFHPFEFGTTLLEMYLIKHIRSGCQEP